jgi:glycosyltransferase involved in cell wall biosynthesis
VTRPAVLSVVIPAFNEEAFIGTLLERVRAVDLSALGVATEIVVVDDCSTDDTARCAEAVTGVRVWRQAANRGKGAAVRAGLARASGDYIVIQDADLEYDPQDYAPMLSELLNTGCDAVYGSRYSVEPSRGRLGGLVTGKHAGQSWPAYIGGRSLSLVAYVCTGARLTDTVTALKLFRRTAILDLPLTTDGFELDHEITAKLVARGRQIREVPVRYAPRSRDEGKKIGARDWVAGVRTFARFRRG